MLGRMRMSKTSACIHMLFNYFDPQFDPEEKEDHLIAFSVLVLALLSMVILVGVFIFVQSWVRLGSSLFVTAVFVGCLYILKQGRLKLAMTVAIRLDTRGSFGGDDT